MKGILIITSILIFPSIINACRILTLSGGGAHGSFQAGVIKNLHEKGIKWDIITGVSAGSFNAGMLGAFKKENQTLGIKLMESLWMNISANDIYNYNWNPISDQSILDSSPLNKTIFNLVSKFNGLMQRDLIVGSVILNTGKMKLFNKSDFTSIISSTNILLASSAIPVIFPPIFFDNQYHVDGGVYSNELVIPGIEYCLEKGDTDIILDVIICSTPIDNITNSDIYSDTIIGIAMRTYDIMTDVVFNHEIYSSCDTNKEIQYAFPMYIYKPEKQYAGGILNFDHTDLVISFNEGYNLTIPNAIKYCYTE